MLDTTFAIVGTAGRKDDAQRLSKNHFEAMCECARMLLRQFEECNYGVNTVVSGGAAWADHVAVKLFLNKEIPKLKLFFPCPYLTEAQQYDSSYITTATDANPRWSPGEVMNGYHSKFTRKVGFNSLREIKLAIEQGAEIHIGKGFYARNALVAQSDIILAMTFGDQEWVKDGGTAHTVMTYLNRVRKHGFFDKSFHYDLTSGEIFAGARVKSEELKK